MNRHYTQAWQWLFALVVVLGCVSTPAVATEQASEEAHEEFHPHYTFELIVGGTREEGEVHPTLGLALGYRFSHQWAIGGVVERTDRGRESTLIMAEVAWFPYERFNFIAGVGTKDPAGKHEMALRMGVGYEVELENDWFIKPFLGVDFIENEENEQLFGLVFGKNF